MSDRKRSRHEGHGPERPRDDSGDTRLREAFQAAPPSGPPGGTGSCPADAAIWQAAHGEIDPAELTGILAHAARCPPCDASWKLARHLDGEAGSPARPTSAPSFGPWPAARWLAAAALILVSAAWLWLARMPGPGPAAPGSEPAFRDGSPVEIATPLPDGSALPRDRFILRWTGLPEGSLATVELADEDLHLLHRVEQQASDSVRIPAQELAGVPAGTPVLWRVEAILPDGRLVSSQAFRVRIED